MYGNLLKGRTALVTGAATGIGEGIAHLFAREGARCVLLDRNEAGCHAVARQLSVGGYECLAFGADVRDQQALEVAVRGTLERFGSIDVLINNAGIYPRRLFLEMTEADWDEMQDINLKGVYRLTRLVAPHMVERGYGKIVNISSVTFFMGLARLSHYVASKAGVIGFTRSISRELGPLGVYANCITPGAIEVEMEKQVATPQQIAETTAQQSIRRRLVPLDIARACLFLASNLSDAMTGQTLNVDGGLITQ